MAAVLLDRFGASYPEFRTWPRIDFERLRDAAEGRWSSTEMLVLRLAELIDFDSGWDVVDPAVLIQLLEALIVELSRT